MVVVVFFGLVNTCRGWFVIQNMMLFGMVQNDVFALNFLQAKAVVIIYDIGI